MIKGKVEFKEETCIFELDEIEFEIKIEIITNREESIQLSHPWDSTPAQNIFEGVLVGKIFDTHQFIHLNFNYLKKVSENQFKGCLNSYLVSDEENIKFDSIDIQADEPNYFYSPQNYFVTKKKSGNHELNFKKEEENFIEFPIPFSKEHINAHFSIETDIKHGSLNPVDIWTKLKLEFKEMNELSFAEGIVFYVRRLLMFLTFRRNINIKKITLNRKPYPSGKSNKVVGEFYLNSWEALPPETEKVKFRIISYPLIEDILHNIMVELALDNIYMLHLPESSKASRMITPERYIMVTAGFEWEFLRLCEGKLTREKKDKYKEERSEILAFFNSKIDGATGKRKKFYVNSKERALGPAHTLEEKLNFAFKEFEEVLNPFVQEIYNSNGAEIEYPQLAKRIAERRNAIGHGNIEKKIHELHGIDMMVVEWIYYAMILRSNNMSDNDIKESISDLFGMYVSLD